MKLTPLDIRHKEFRRGMRGYTDTDVDEFLDQVADEFERVFKENIELSERIEALQEQIGHYRTIEETLQKTLITAQQSAEEMKASAQKEAQLILRDADLRAKDVVSDAERKARDTLSEAYSSKQAVEKETVVLRNAEADFRFRFRQMLEGYVAQLNQTDDAAGRGGEFTRQAEILKATLETENLLEEDTFAGMARARPVADTASAGVDQSLAAVPPTRAWWEPPPVPAVEEPPAGSLAAGPFTAPPRTRKDEGEDTQAMAPPADELEASTDDPQETALSSDEELLADVDDAVGDNEFKW